MERNRQALRIFRSSAWSRAWRSLVAFLLGLLLAFIYGVMAIYIQKHALWFCIITTVTMAAFTAFGMGLSVSVRANITLMLPMLCSSECKKILLLLLMTLIAQGPMNNTVENFDRAAASVLCGVELAMNQTQQLMQRAATPLLPVLEKVREVSRNAYSLAGRVQNLIKAFTESVRHVSRSLRNVLHFLARIGDICNEKMGTPYKKCNSVFDKGRADCMELLSVFSFLCHIIDGFRPLCGLTRVGELFCVIPSYIADHLKTNLAFPIIAAFNEIKKEFEFNMSASVHFDMNLNSSQSVHQMTQKIMEELSQTQERILDIMGLLTYVGLFMLLFMYLKAVLYKKHYLHVDDFDNIYITEQFVELDHKLYKQGEDAVLPLSKKETLTYINPYCMRLTVQEWRRVKKGLWSMIKPMIMGSAVIFIDVMVYYVFDILHYHAQEEIVAKAPMVVNIKVNGSGYASDIYKDIVTSFDILQKGNITVLSKKCLMEPLKTENVVYLFIGFLYGLAFAVVLVGSYAKRLQWFVCTRYYPQREKARIMWLHSHIVSQRKALQNALFHAVSGVKESQENADSVMQTLVLRLPGGVTIARFLGLYDKSCLSCGKILKVENSSEMHTCSTQNCTGCFCMQCFRKMGNSCAFCKWSLKFQNNSDYERDSSDEEQANLSPAATTSPPHVNENPDRNVSVETGNPVNTEDQNEEHTSESELCTKEDKWHNCIPKPENIV